MPASSEKIRKIFGKEKAVWKFTEVKPGIKLDNIEVLFTKIDEKEIIKEIEEQKAKALALEKQKAREEKEKQKEAERKEKSKEEITIDYLDKISLKVAKVLEAEEVEGSDKLLKLKVSLGLEERQIVAGIKKYYKPEELIGKKIVIVANLKPAKLKGIESQGMVLAAGDGDIVRVLTVDDEIELGADVH